MEHLILDNCIIHKSRQTMSWLRKFGARSVLRFLTNSFVTGNLNSDSRVGMLVGGYVVNIDPGGTLTYMRSAMTRSVVTDMAAAGRSDTIGNSVGNFSACVGLFNQGLYPQCKLGSGTFGDRGFGTCGTAHRRSPILVTARACSYS
jgi:hypothetical protein